MNPFEDNNNSFFDSTLGNYLNFDEDAKILSSSLSGMETPTTMEDDTKQAMGFSEAQNSVINEFISPEQPNLGMNDAMRQHDTLIIELAQKNLTRSLQEYRSIISSPTASRERLHEVEAHILTLRMMIYNFGKSVTQVGVPVYTNPPPNEATPIIGTPLAPSSGPPQTQTLLVTSSTGNEYIFPQPPFLGESNSVVYRIQPRNTVMLAYDDQMAREISEGETINMDLGVYALMFNVFADVPPSKDKIFVDDSVYFSGAKKAAQDDPARYHFSLTAVLRDQSDKPMVLCNTCSQKKKSILYIKDARRVGNDLKMLVAFSCSGAPTDVKRPLRAAFIIYEGANQATRQIKVMQHTQVFRVYHHRRKRARESETTSTETQIEVPQIPNLAKKLKPRTKLTKCSFYGDLVQPVKELFNHMREIVDADATNMKFNEPTLHQALWNLNAFMVKNNDAIGEDSQLLVPLSEFYLNLAAINNIVYDPDVQYTKPDEEMSKLMKFNFEKAAETCLRVLSDKRKPKWLTIMQLIWKLSLSFDERKTCTCEGCRFCHIAFIVKYATKNGGNSHSKIASSLEEYQIQTKQGKHWHKSLNGLLSKEIYFSWTFFFETGNPIGSWSRQWYPFKRIRDSYIRSMKDIFYTYTPASLIVFKGLDVSAFIPFMRLTLNLIDTVEQALSNFDKSQYPQFHLTDGIDKLVNGLKTITLTNAPQVPMQPPQLSPEDNYNNSSSS